MTRALEREDETSVRDRAALVPLAWLYGAGAAAWRRLTQVPRRDRGDARVVSVGGLEVGGSGKTPLAMLLLTEALAHGMKCAYASRAYASRAGRSRAVTVVEPASSSSPVSRAGIRVVSRRHPDLAREVGDEAAVVVERVPGVALFLSRDKPGAVDAALATGVDLVIVDDAFQTWALARDIDIVLVDARYPLANGRLLPAGPLREVPRALARADAVVFSRVERAEDVVQARGKIARWMNPAARAYGLRRTTSLVRVDGTAARAPARAFIVSGIARPRALEDAVSALGVEVVGHAVFRDHHAYTARDAGALADRCRNSAAGAIVTTEKDWVKLRRFEWAGVDVIIARLDVEWAGERVRLWK